MDIFISFFISKNFIFLGSVDAPVAAVTKMLPVGLVSVVSLLDLGAPPTAVDEFNLIKIF